MHAPSRWLENDAASQRRPGHPVHPLFLRRWSPRAFDASTMPLADLLSLLEAARWAPSAYNLQPWRFIHVRREERRWPACLALLDAFNAAWAAEASALVFLVSDRLNPGDGLRPSPTHRFDAGAAWAQLALQATALGYQAHAMAGIDVAAIRRELAVPERFEVEIAIAIGRSASPEHLPRELRERERPSLRRPLGEIAFAAGHFDAARDGGPRS